jgi:microsomal dipeptidase-like Zn-dependent dipeptidase
MKRVLRWFSLLVAVTVVGALILAAPIVETQMNHVLAGPRSVTERARTLHASLTWVDLHADPLLWGRDLTSRSSRGHIDVPRLIDGNVALQMFTMVTQSPRNLNIERNDDSTDNVKLLAIVGRWPLRTWNDLTQRALYQAQRLADMAARSDGRLVRIKSRADLDAFLARRAKEPHIVGALLGAEGAHALGTSLAHLDQLDGAGLRMISMTHFFDNAFGGSASGVDKGGLTPLGRTLAAEMEKRGMLIDVSHCSPKVVDDLLKLATKPVIASHTGVRGTCNNNRNLTDDQLRGIAKTGGVVGIGYWDTAVCGTEPNDIARAVKYVRDLVGIEHVAFGSDFDGAVDVPFDTARLAELTDALLANGLTEDEIRKVAGENAIRVLRAILPPT